METRKTSLNLKYDYLAKSILFTSIMHCIIIHLELYERIHRALQQSKMQDSTSFIGYVNESTQKTCQTIIRHVVYY